MDPKPLDSVTDALDPTAMTEAAQQAADAGDYHAAERLLREAAAIQEATLGPLHSDLASTLNNLALVCERTNNLAEAERGYRRAHAIAVASLGPRHPFVATSVKNLVGFCAAHGIPIWKPPASRSDTVAESSETTAGSDVTQLEIQAGAVHEATAEANAIPDVGSAPEERPEPAPVVLRRTPVIAMTALAVVAIAAVVLINERAPETVAPIDAPRPSPTAPAPSRPPAPLPTTLSAPRGVQPEVTAEANPETTAGRAEHRALRDGIAAPQAVTVLNARLCTTLERRGSPDWQCSSADGDLQPGTYVFYTRLLAKANTTVEHRWYRGDRLHQAMRLRIAANQGSGYRTFSSNTISVERAGNWKVELRAADGTVLQEQRFVISLP